VNQEEVESQLSAMFDGELPPAECQLLSRRIDREEGLRTRWSRYTMIGAVMRAEPVVAARAGFAQRVSVALSAEVQRHERRRKAGTIRTAALAAALVSAVAGLSVLMLRNVVTPAPQLVARSSQPSATPAPAQKAPAANAVRDPASEVTPRAGSSSSLRLQTQLADFVVAHSEYSTPLIRPSLLSSLVSSDAAAEPAPLDSSANDAHQDIAGH